MTEIKWNFTIKSIKGELLAIGSINTIDLSHPQKYLAKQGELYKPCIITVTTQDGKKYSKTVE